MFLDLRQYDNLFKRKSHLLGHHHQSSIKIIHKHKGKSLKNQYVDIY